MSIHRTSSLYLSRIVCYLKPGFNVDILYKMPTCWSRVRGHFQNDEDDAASCSICFESYNNAGDHIDLVCGHDFCVSCIARYFLDRMKTQGVFCDFPCPLCRRDVRVSVRRIDGEPIGRAFNGSKLRSVVAIEDALGNAHPVISSTSTSPFEGRCYASPLLRDGRSLEVYDGCLVWNDPYRGVVFANASVRLESRGLMKL